MKFSISILTFLSFILLFSNCECEEPILTPISRANSPLSGQSVVTRYAYPRGNVAAIYNTRNTNSAPRGAEWAVPRNTQIVGPNWNAQSLGQVFGIAIDGEENIYFANSDIYSFDQGTGFAPPSWHVDRRDSLSRIYKASASGGYVATEIFSTDCAAQALNGFGNITYDRLHDQLLVSNLEDGNIYMLDTDGNLLATFDPWSADIAVPGIVKSDEQVWGLAVGYEGLEAKLYFPRVYPGERSIYSVKIGQGVFDATTEQLEISNIPGVMPIISDLAISDDGANLLVSERGNPQRAVVMNYAFTGSAWSFDRQYFIGSISNGECSAGGVDFGYEGTDVNPSEQCNSLFWASGSYMRPRAPGFFNAFGVQGVWLTGNLPASSTSPTANIDTDLFIDADGNDSSDVGVGLVGDVEVFDAYECYSSSIGNMLFP